MIWAGRDFVGRCGKRKERGVGPRGGERRWAGPNGDGFWGLGLFVFFLILLKQLFKTFLN
jgi:hypothetical protein